MSDINQFEEILASGGIPISGGDASADEEAEDDDDDITNPDKHEGTSSLSHIVAKRIQFPFPRNGNSG